MTAKYRNKKIIVNGITFDSKKEAKRYTELLMLERSGEISCLELQKPYELIPKQKLSNGKTERACKYVADFCFKRDGKVVVEDVKGLRKGVAYQLFVMKRKWMLFLHKIEIIEI